MNKKQQRKYTDCIKKKEKTRIKIVQVIAAVFEVDADHHWHSVWSISFAAF